MNARFQTPVEERRAELALDLLVHERTFGGDTIQGFCAVVAAGLDCGVPGPVEFAEVPEAERTRFMAARARMLEKLGADGGRWLAAMGKALRDEFEECYMGESDWLKRTAALGLSEDDFCREALVCALVTLSLAGEAQPMSAGGVA